MNIIIIGAGALGLNLAEHLNQLQHKIAIIERNDELATEIGSRFDVLALAGEGTSLSMLESAGIEGADMIIAVTPSDEVNLAICGIARQYGVKKRVARIRSREWTQSSKFSLGDFGVTEVIEAGKELVNTVIQYIELPGLLETTDFRNIRLRGYRITEDMPIAGKTLRELSEMVSGAQLLIVAIIRNGESLIPTGDQRLLTGDEFIAIMSADSFKTYRDLINRPEAKLKKVILAGGSAAAVSLAESLTEYAERVILVDSDPERGRTTAEQLSSVEVLQGDCTDTMLLQEIAVKTADFFVGASPDTEDNIMACLLAKAEGAHEVIAIRSDNRHMDLFHTLGIDHVINPSRITLQRIIESIHAVPIGPLLQLRKVDLDVLRVVPDKRSPVIGKRLSQLDGMLQRSMVIGAIVHDETVTIPHGNTIIEEGDEIIAICRHKSIPLINQVFKVKLRF